MGLELIAARPRVACSTDCPRQVPLKVFFNSIFLMSTNAGVAVPGTEVLAMRNYPKPRLISIREVEIVVMELSKLSILGFL